MSQIQSLIEKEEYLTKLFESLARDMMDASKNGSSHDHLLDLAHHVLDAAKALSGTRKLIAQLS